MATRLGGGYDDHDDHEDTNGTEQRIFKPAKEPARVRGRGVVAVVCLGCFRVERGCVFQWNVLQVAESKRVYGKPERRPASW